MVVFMVVAMVVHQMDTQYPIIDAVCELLRNTDMKKATEIWQSPHPKKTMNKRS
jgi:hypothetical protein